MQESNMESHYQVRWPRHASQLGRAMKVTRGMSDVQRRWHTQDGCIQSKPPDSRTHFEILVNSLGKHLPFLR